MVDADHTSFLTGTLSLKEENRGAPDPAFPVKDGARVRGIVLPFQRDLGSQVLPLRPEDLFHCLYIWAGYCQWEDHSPPSRKEKGTSGGLAICISGCADNQTSADTTALTGNANATTGAMTYSLIYAFQHEPGLSYGRLLTTMRSVIRGANTSSNSKLNGPVGSLLRQVLKCGLRQVALRLAGETPSGTDLE